MALRVITGVPGAGKTYFAAWHLLHNYFKWDETRCWWIPKNPELKLITNIEGFKLGIPLDPVMDKAGGPLKFFTVPAMKALYQDSPVVLIIDEAQRYFDRKFYDKSVFYYLQYHRHLGHDIYIITQDVDVLAKELRNLCEYQIVAARRSLSFLGEFRYRFVQGAWADGDAFMTKVLKRDPRIFAVYSSMSAGESEKISSAPRRVMVWALVCLLVMGLALYRFYSSMLGGTRKAVAAPIAEEHRQPIRAGDLPSSRGNGYGQPGPVPSTPLAADASTAGNGGPVAGDLDPRSGPGFVPAVAFSPAFVVYGRGRLLAEVEHGDSCLYVIEEDGEQRIVEEGDVIRIFRRKPDGLIFGRVYPAYTWVQTPEEASAASEHRRKTEEAAALGGLNKGSATRPSTPGGSPPPAAVL